MPDLLLPLRAAIQPVRAWVNHRLNMIANPDDRRRAELYTSIIGVFGPLILLVGLGYLVVRGIDDVVGLLYLGVALGLLCVMAPLTLLGFHRWVGPMNVLTLGAASTAALYLMPTYPVPVGAFAVAMVLTSLTERARTTVLVCTLSVLAAAMPDLVPLGTRPELTPGLDLMSRIGVLVSVAGLCILTSSRSGRLMNDLERQATDNRQLGIQLADKRQSLHEDVEVRTAELQLKTSALEKATHELREAAALEAEMVAQLKVLSEHDQLTELMNRRGFMGVIGQAPSGTWLLMGDVDRFKSVNDTHGHHVGDEVLKGIAACLREALVPGAVVARLGGEEFAVLLPTMPERELVSHVEAMLAAVRALTWEHVAGPRLKTSISFGAARLRSGADAVAEAMRVADDALYQAKEAGRDRLVLAGSSEGTVPSQRRSAELSPRSV